MKKNPKPALIALATALFATAGCSNADTKVPNAAGDTAKVSVTPGKVLVAFYSRSGNTRFMAEEIRKATGGTLFEIKPATPYPEDYKACTEQAKKEIAEGFKPELAGKLESIDAYDVIFVGSPNWWGTLAPPVSAFLASHDFAGKTVVPFFTHGSGGLQNCEKDLQKLCEKATFLKAGPFAGDKIKESSDAIAQWVESVVSIKKEEAKP